MEKKHYYRVKHEQKHMSINVKGCLNNHKKRKIDYFEYDDGRPMTHQAAMIYLHNADAEGKRLIPIGDCYRFDHQKGCKGHIISLTPNKEKLAEIEEEYNDYMGAYRFA